MASQILTTKITRPPARLRTVARPRLIEVLNEGLERKCTLVAAPAGFGKTTLLGEWANGCARPLAWMVLEEGDNDLDRFLALLVSALEIADPGLKLSETALAARQSLQPLPVETVVSILVNRLAAWSHPMILVIDDYHLVDNQDIHQLLTSLIDHLPQSLHVVIASRSEPALPLARWRVEGQLNELTEEALRFTLEETRVFFIEVMTLQLSQEQAAALEARTEGWIAGLQLAGLSLQSGKDPSAFIESLSGEHRYILDYLAEEVLGGLPTILKAFLLRVCILERMTGELCDVLVEDLSLSQELPQALRGEAASSRLSQPILEFLDASNLFILPLDYERRWYRFHQLFRDFLLNRLKAQQPEQLPDLHRRAAAWYAGSGLIHEAIQHALEGGDLERAAELMQGEARRMLTQGEVATLLRWTDRLPESILYQNPHLGLAHAWAMLMIDPLRLMANLESHMRILERGLGIEGQDVLEALIGSDPASPKRGALGELLMLQAYAQRDVETHANTISRFEAVLEYMPEGEDVLRGFAQAGLASTLARAGEIRAAERAFAQAADASRAAGSLYGFIASKDWQGVMQAMQGRLRRALQTYREVLDLIQEQGGVALPLTGHVYVGLAEILLEQNDLEAAQAHLWHGVQLGEKVRDHDALIQGNLLLGRLRTAQGDMEGARQAFDRSEREAHRLESMPCLQDALAWRTRLELLEGNVEAATRWATARMLDGRADAEGQESAEEIELLTYARLLIAQRRPDEALRIIADLLEQAERAGHGRDVIELLTLRALAHRAQGNLEAAQRSLARALILAEPEGFVRIFLEGGAPMAALLRSAAALGHSPDYAQTLLTAFGETLLEGAPLEPLSEREMQVLSLMAQGLTNAEIAQELVIAQSTVKTHINRIYSKLGVRGRTQAIAQAHTLRLLP